ncbi:hypothetical protein GCM10027053_53310 [Intrasporangium mesophilum]
MTPHLRNHVRAYVDRALPPALLHLYDRHVVCCTMCRAAADQERRIVASLRSDTGVPMSLRSSLIGLATAPPAPEVPVHSGPRIPLPPIGFRMPSAPSYDPVPTVSPGAPALHRSPMRAAVVASIAAGASVAAAWGLAVSPVSGSGGTSRQVPVAHFGQNSLTGLNGHSLPVSRTSSSSGTMYGPAMPVRVTVSYWVVATGTAHRDSDLGPVRFTSVSSAQSGP